MKRSKRKTNVQHACELIEEALADGPKRPRDVVRLARERGFSIDEKTWAAARERLGVESIGSGKARWWTWPGEAFEDAFAAWLVTPRGRFASYVAERDRLAEKVAVGQQLELR